ncbi:hypothetical protein EDC19_0485 [Natranaerovirga hydrolytica]|uniref:Septicolysin n=1 Tax=Natranaerovirga hydrolytica TaxID=680378 RepID=A0A4R1MXR5_9FIRM|nr:DIP1984 family protein [Natranaerovirga hydrolytica]TCK98068.1 hypothetical protein EDC19_0485 [Natranaerovirga hydrolytica]
MKLAEALMYRSDYQVKIEKLKNRIVNNVQIQEGEELLEDPKTLLKELNFLTSELEEIIQKINRTNSQTPFDENMTISDALAKRDIMMLKRRALEDVFACASIRQTRISRSEIKFMTTIDVLELQKEIDQLSKAFRKIDTKIQELNWKTELL